MFSIFATRALINASAEPALVTNSLVVNNGPSACGYVVMSSMLKIFNTQEKINNNTIKKPNIEKKTDFVKEIPIPPISVVKDIKSPPLNFIIEGAIIPHPAKVEKGGEDAFFISDDGTALGVADGVGGWELEGVDPSIYSNTLMASASSVANNNPNLREPIEILDQAYKKCIGIKGSSTACIITIKNNNLYSANVGDSGFLLIRNGSIIYRTKEQQHYFNCPYQLGYGSADVPADAHGVILELQENDIIIVGSDGLFDNMFETDILDCINKIGGNDLRKLAYTIAETARQYSVSVDRVSPFEVNAYRSGYQYSGGKSDDITVLVAKTCTCKKWCVKQKINV